MFFFFFFFFFFSFLFFFSFFLFFFFWLPFYDLYNDNTRSVFRTLTMDGLDYPSLVILVGPTS
jgi:hypothetical protein